MLKRLQVKFVVINMTMVTIMLFVIFGLVYNFTERNLEAESVSMMKAIAADPFQVRFPNDPSLEDINLPFFTLLLGVDGELIASGGGYYDLSNKQFLKELVHDVIQNRQEIGVIKAHHLRYCRVKMPMGTVMVFSDMSSENATLTHLLKSCLIIGGISFLVFLVISIFLAKWAVKPVEHAWKQQKQFVADASHELKTPLTVIMTNAELMKSTDPTKEEQDHLLQSIALMSRQMKQLVESMLLLAKSDTQQMPVHMITLNLGEILEDEVISFEGIFADRGLVLESFADVDIFVRGNEESLRQLIGILLDNAQKYSFPGSKTQVFLCRKEWNKCWLKVSNPGKEIPQEELQYIFQRFYRLDKARSRDGSFGLGLSIAENITARHHGKIWAESQDGINSFIVELKTKR